LKIEAFDSKLWLTVALTCKGKVVPACNYHTMKTIRGVEV